MPVSRKEQGRRRRAAGGAAAVAVVGAVLLVAPGAALRAASEIDVPDVIGETALAVLAAAWLLLIPRMRMRAVVFWPMAAGMVLLFAGALLDVADEFLVAARRASIVENFGKLIGTLVITVAIRRWLLEQAQQTRRFHRNSLRFEKLSVTDGLTQLFNRAHFFERLESELARPVPTSLILLDIDSFKLHNDTYGHLEGDKVLVKLATVIRSSIRDADLPCRYGGEEFTVILADTELSEAVPVAERIREAFAEVRFEPRPGERVHKTISVGVAQAAEDESAAQLVERTDLAMFAAKKAGKNRVQSSHLP